MTFYVQYCFLGSCFSTALFYKAFFSEVTTVTAQLNKTSRGPSRFLQASVGELYMGTHFFAKTGYLTKQVVQGSARLVCAYRVLCLPWDTHLQTYKSLQVKCLILCMQHTPTHTHTHTHIHIYAKEYICMYVHINIFNSCPYLPI